MHVRSTQVATIQPSQATRDRLLFLILGLLVLGLAAIATLILFASDSGRSGIFWNMVRGGAATILCIDAVALPAYVAHRLWHWRLDLVLVALVALSGALLDYYHLIQWPTTIAVPFIAPLLALWIIVTMLFERRTRLFLPMTILWVTIPIITLPALLHGTPFSESAAYYVALMGVPTVMYALGNNVIQSPQSFRILLQLIMGVGLLIALHTIIEAHFNFFLFPNRYSGQYSQSISPFSSGIMVHRAGSFLLNPDANGTFLAVMLMLPICLFSGSRSWFEKSGYCAAIALLSIALLDTYSFGAFAAALGGLAIFVFSATNRKVLLISGGLLAGFVAIVMLLLSHQVRAFVVHATNPQELSMRFGLWIAGLHVIRDHPLLGIGLSHSLYQTVSWPYRFAGQTRPEPTPHNSYLEIAALAGIPTLIIFIALLVGAIGLVWRNARASDRATRRLLIGVLAGVATLSLNSMEAEAWTLRPVSWLVWILLGAAASPWLVAQRSVIAPLSPPSLDQPELVKADITNEPVPQTTDPFAPSVPEAHMRPSLAEEVAPNGPTTQEVELILDTTSWNDVATEMVSPVASPRRSASRVLRRLGATDRTDALGIVFALIKTSGIYAITSFISPLVAIVLAPFLTRHLLQDDYARLTLLLATLSFLAPFTQLGLSAAFFRAYNQDFQLPHERRRVMGTLFILIIGTSLLALALLGWFALWLAKSLLRDASFAPLVRLLGFTLLMQNLTVPGMVWLRVENRPIVLTVASLANIAVSLGANVYFVGIQSAGVEGALLATSLGYSVMAIATLPFFLRRMSFPHSTIAASMLLFGLPLIPNSIAFWLLQLADRYLLAWLGSFAQVATYSVGYTLGWAVVTIFITPFLLAWAPLQYKIAQRSDALLVFQTVFRLFSLTMLFIACALSLGGLVALDLFFPNSYVGAENVIPIINLATVFYGLYIIFMTGANVRRKPWLLGIAMMIAALINIALNVLLIPLLGATGAALATLIGYIILMLSGYIGHQRIYPVPYQMGRFWSALFLGLVSYGAPFLLARYLDPSWFWPARAIAFVGFGLCLLGFAFVKTPQSSAATGESPHDTSAPFGKAGRHGNPTPIVCMFVPSPGKTDVRVVREGLALVDAGYRVVVVDIEHDRQLPKSEQIHELEFRHIVMSWRATKHYSPLRTFPWLWFKVRRWWRGMWRVLRTRADVYHAHDVIGLPVCFLAAWVRHKALIFDVHELPMVQPHLRRHAFVRMMALLLLRLMMTRCAAIITVSPQIADELRHSLTKKQTIIVRNIPDYVEPRWTNRIREYLHLGPMTRIALYQGLFQSNRSLDMLIQAAPFLDPDIVCVFMGKGEQQPMLEQLIVSLHMEDRVKFVPFAPFDELLSWTSSADLGLLIFDPEISLSIRYCLPNKFFEYLMAGLPILTSALDAVVDVVTEYDLGRIVPDLTPLHIAQAINMMLADIEAWQRYHLNSLHAARDAFRWDREKMNLVECYRQIVGLASPDGITIAARQPALTPDTSRA